MSDSEADDGSLADGDSAAAAKPGTEASRPSRRAFLTGLAAGAAAVGVPAAIALTRDSNGIPSPTTNDLSSPLVTNAGAEPGTPAEVRRNAALQIREQAARLAADIELPTHRSNGDELAEHGYAFSFVKGLPHDYETGLVARPADYERFVAAIESGQPQDFIDTPLGPDDGFRTAPDDSPLRAWESQSIGLAFDLIGPDMQALTMPPAPAAGSTELTGEMAEVYAQAILRDESLSNLRFDGSTSPRQERVIDALNSIEWFDDSAPSTGLPAETRRRRRAGLNLQTAFRGIAPGDTTGPYLSQLLLVGAALPDESRRVSDGLLQYGAQTISQRVRQAAPVDFMTSWDEWFDIQNALAPGQSQVFDGPDRFITSGRDLASYVQDDALYQSYLNACLVLFSQGVPLDAGTPFIGTDNEDHQQGFVLFARPHVLSMLAEVCMRALKTVKYQKFNVHRRLRPEELAARVERADVLEIADLSDMASVLTNSLIGEDIRTMTQAASGTPSMLLPMAYAEGSPMHPSYGAGHGTVAGACSTILKAFFDHTHPLGVAGSAGNAFVPNRDGSSLEQVRVFDATGQPAQLTVEGEVNKLAANIALARGWAGVHYFSDYWESMLLGEAIAIEILREHMLTSTVEFTLTVPTFEGNTVVVAA